MTQWGGAKLATFTFFCGNAYFCVNEGNEVSRQ